MKRDAAQSEFEEPGRAGSAGTLLSKAACYALSDVPRTAPAHPGKSHPKPRSARKGLAIVLLSAIFVVCTVARSNGEPVSAEWRKMVTEIVWVAYSPTEANPDRGVQASPAAVRADLAVLRKAGFTGLVTYGASAGYVQSVVAQAEAQQFEGLILGVWDPASEPELAVVAAVSDHPLVLGYCVGNEGLGRRYSFETLSGAIAKLRRDTGKPVATTEECDDYIDDEVTNLGDWVFPNVHPFFHGRFDAKAAVRWTVGAFEAFISQTRRFVWFKEVGLPTGGDRARPLSEKAQELYYKLLAKTPVRFTYFEAFDQPWKNPGSVEVHWGLFRADRSAKGLAAAMLERGPLPRPLLRAESAPPKRSRSEPRGIPKEPFYVYLDGGAPQNHFRPTGYDGDCGDIKVDEGCTQTPHSGSTCIRIAYQAKGKGPNQCTYAPPCKWAGLGWRQPAGNNGKDPRHAGKGHDLAGYNRLVFWARAESDCRIAFSVGGLDEAYGDSLTYPRSILAGLTDKWQRFAIDLRGADLGHLVSGFGWATNWDLNPDGAVFFIDDVRFEQ